MRARWWVASAAAVALLLIAWWLLRPAAPTSVAGAASAEPVAPREAAAADVTQGASVAAAPSEITTSRLGVPVHVVKRPRLGVKPPYGPAFAQLEPAARAGDVQSQYLLGLLLYECQQVPADAAALERDVDRVHQTHQREGWDVADPAIVEQAMRERFSECAGVPQQARAEYRDWLKRAADAGLIEAQIELPLHLPPGEWCQYLSDCTPQQRAAHEALEQEALDYIGRARDAGSADALWTFGAWYEQGEVLPENDVEAYAHFLALDEINAAAGNDRRFDPMLDQLRARLRPVDLDRAEARARELLANPKCCVITP